MKHILAVLFTLLFAATGADAKSLKVFILAGSLKVEINQMEPKLRYAAIRSVSTNPDGMARATLENFFQNPLSQDDVIALAPVILAAVENPRFRHSGKSS